MADSQPQPFNDKDVLFRFEPTQEEAISADELVLTHHPDRTHAVRAYVREGTAWFTGAGFMSIIVVRLLAERAALTAERDCYRTALQDFTQRTFPRLQYGYNSWELTELTQAVFCEALEQGAMIREGK